MSWHDSACYRTKQFVCEDSDKMVVTMIDDEDDHGGDVDSDKMVVMMTKVTTKMMIDGGGEIDDADFEAVRFHGLQ